MKTIVNFICGFVTLFILPSVFAQENITITTYYPSPVGVYQNIRYFPTTTQPACDANNEGITYYDNNTNLLMICRQTGTAPDVYSFQSASGLWVQIGSTGPNGADPIAMRPVDTDLKVGIGDINVGWNRQNRLAVTDNTSANGLGEQIALMEILNPRRGNSGNWSGAGDSVTALQLTPGGASWQVRADEFNSAVAGDSAAAGAFMIHQTVNGNPATRLVIRNNGNTGIGNLNPQSRLDVTGGVTIGTNYAGTNAAPANGLITEGRVGIGTATPISGTVGNVNYNDVILHANGAIYSNGAKGSGHEFSVTRAELVKYHNGVPAGHGPNNQAELMSTMAACNRFCSTGCPVGGANCTVGTPGKGYHGGTSVEWDGVGNVNCFCD